MSPMVGLCLFYVPRCARRHGREHGADASVAFQLLPHFQIAFGRPDAGVVVARGFVVGAGHVEWHAVVENNPVGIARLHEIVGRSEEYTSELQSLMRISYAVFCLKKKNKTHTSLKQIATT